MSESAAPLMGADASDPRSRIIPILRKIKALPAAIWTRTSRRMRLLGALAVFILLSIGIGAKAGVRPPSPASYVPKIRFEYEHSPYNASKVALLIENRPLPLLAPLMLHFIAVVPPDWRFRFMGSPESVEHINGSMAIREQVAMGKLDLTYIPANMSTAGQEMISRFLTTQWLYEVVLQPAEWLLVFQTDSILCANSPLSINDFLQYDWIGAPWRRDSRWGGNGGLSLRRVSTMLDVLRNQVRVEDSEPEDVWLAERVSHHPGALVANGSESMRFSGEHYAGDKVVINNEEAIKKYGSVIAAAREGVYVEEIDGWRAGFYEPMGYHAGGSGKILHGEIWGKPELRKHIWDYCPEVKMTLAMDLAKYVPGQCKASWKRDLHEVEGVDVENEWPYGTEIIDGVEYPMLPPNLTPF